MVFESRWTERASIWDITRPISIIILTDFAWKTKKTKTHPITKFLPIFQMVGAKRIDQKLNQKNKKSFFYGLLVDKKIPIIQEGTFKS